MISLPPPPDRSVIIDETTRDARNALASYITQHWLQWFLAIKDRVDRAPMIAGKAGAQTLQAALPSTVLGQKAGYFRITYVARVTQPAGGNSSLTVRFSWNDGGVAQGYTGPAMTGNSQQTYQSNSFTIHSDGTVPTRVDTLYSSSGSPSMQYALGVMAEELPL